MSYRSLFDELEKIGRKKKDEKLVPAKPIPMANRVMGGMMGAGMLLGNVGYLGAKLPGRATVYHGTTPERAAKIVAPTSLGIDPAFAGYADPLMGAKEKRINRALMGDSLNRLLDKHKVPLSYEQMASIPDRFNRYMDVHGMQSGEASQRIFHDVTDELVRSGQLTPEIKARIGSELGPELSRHGQRVYAATSPAAALPWASGKSEASMLASAARKKAMGSSPANMGRALVEGVTFGMPTTLSGIWERLKYRPQSVESMPLADLHTELQNVATHTPTHNIVFGVRTPTGGMGYLEDFPAARQLMGFNPGMKPGLREAGISTYEPGRDLSFAHALPKEHIRHVDIVDPATKAIRRINVSDARTPARSPISKSFKGMLLPAAATAAGAYTLYRAFKPKKRMVPQSSPLAETKEKRGSVRSDVWRVGKYLLPASAAAAGLGIGASKLTDMAIPSDPNEGSASRMAKMQGRMAASGLGTGLASMGIGALAGIPLLAKTRLGLAERAIVGAGGGYLTGMTAGMGSAMGREMGKTPEVDPYSSWMPDQAQDVIRRNPWIAGVRNAAIATALPLAGLYAFRKYYPGTYSKAHLWAANKMGV